MNIVLSRRARAILRSLRRPIEVVLGLCGGGNTNMDCVVHRVVELHLLPVTGPNILTKRALAEELLMRAPDVGSKLCLLAASLVHCGKTAL